MITKNKYDLFMEFKIIFILLCFLSLNTYAQGGTIKGKVIDKESSEVLIGTNVIILGLKLGAATDINGYYKISNIPPGTYPIRVSFIGYAPAVRQNVNVKNSDDLILNFELEWDYNSPFEIIQEKPLSLKMVTSCPTPWSVDMIPIREIYYLNIMERFNLNPPELKPVVVEHPHIDN